MKKKQLQLKKLPMLLALAALFCLGTFAGLASVSAQDNKPVQDNDTTRAEVTRFDQFLDSHREIAEQLRKDPGLVNNRDFVEKHPALQSFLQQQPGVREELRENPNAFMRQENNFDRREDMRDRDSNRAGHAQFDQFLDSHREIAEQLRKDPTLVNNKDFVEKHPPLQSFLQQQPGVREQITQNPNAFMRQENNFERPEEARDRDANRAGHAQFDQFLDGHREIAEQLRKDPTLVNNRDFVEKHPALQSFLQQQPGVREQITQNPNTFMRQEDNFNRPEEGRDRDTNHAQVASFKQFLDGHSNIAQQLSKDPSQVKNHEYVQNHPELQEYLKANPGVQEALMKNPQTFVNSTNAPSNNASEPVKSGDPVKAPPVNAKPKQ